MTDHSATTLCPYQRTLRREISLRGIGLHSGQAAEMCLVPAPANHGIAFQRTDLPEQPCLAATTQNIFRSQLCTTLGSQGVRISTVEHLLAACYCMGVHNLLVQVNADELPITDGSALPFVQLIKQAGLIEQKERRAFIRIRKTITVKEGDRIIEVKPSRRLAVDCTLDFAHPLITDQRLSFIPRNGNFEKEIAPARTFGFLKDVQKLRKSGLALGGSLDNAVVIDCFSILNPHGLRYPDEFVRHKVLDILGDLALLGHVVLGQIRAYKSGHMLHHRLIHAIMENKNAWEKIQLGNDGEAVSLPVEPSLPVPGLQSA